MAEGGSTRAAESEENQLLVHRFPFYYSENHLHNFFVNTLGVQGLLRTKIRKKHSTQRWFFKDDILDEETGKYTFLSNADHWDKKKGQFVYKVANLIFENELFAIDALPLIDGSVLPGNYIEGDYFIKATKKTPIPRGPIGELSAVPEPDVVSPAIFMRQNPFPHFRGRYQPPEHRMAMQGSQPLAPQSPQRVIPPPVQYPSMAMQGPQPPAPQSPQRVVPPPVQYPGVALQGQPGVDDAAFNALSQELDQLLMEDDE